MSGGAAARPAGGIPESAREPVSGIRVLARPLTRTAPGGGVELGKVGGVAAGCKVVARAIHANAVKGSR